MVEAALREALTTPAVWRAWLRPVQAAIDSALANLDPASEATAAEELLQRRGSALSDAIPGLFRDMSTAALESILLRAMAAADVNGRVERLLALGDSLSLADDASTFVDRPITVEDANRWLARKALVPTSLKASQIGSVLAPPLRNQAFFSAQVSSANVLAELKNVCERVAAGEFNYTQGISRLQEFLAAQGYPIPKPGSGDDANLELLSTATRLRLVLRQNVSMAHAVGQRRVSEAPGVIDRWPNYRYIANTDRHASYDGLVLPKIHPFWRTHYPPWDYGCQCMVVDEDGDANTVARGFERDSETGSLALPAKGRTIEVTPNTSGFVFDSTPAQAFGDLDWTAISDARLRAIAEQRQPA